MKSQRQYLDFSDKAKKKKGPEILLFLRFIPKYLLDFKNQMGLTEIASQRFHDMHKLSEFELTYYMH